MNFDSFLGNEKVKERLTFLLSSGRLPHAIIIEGEEGIGKRTLAREIALNLFCRSDSSPCRNCSQCSKVMKKIHPDIYEYTAPDRPRAFHIDTVREVREDAFMRPNESEYKVYILGNAQSMSENAQNALLKILEEPPEYAIFILTVTNKASLLETVLSRSVVITLEGVEPAVAAKYIIDNTDCNNENEAENAVQAWHGNIGKAIESLSDGKYSKTEEISDRIAMAVLSENEYDLIKICSAFSGDREMLSLSLEMLKAIFRDALVYDCSKPISASSAAVSLLSSRLSKGKLLKLIEVCDRVASLAQKNANNAILITKLPYELKRAVGR